MTNLKNNACLYCSESISGTEHICNNCYDNFVLCECCYNLFAPYQTIEYGLLSTRRCTNCINNTYYACVCCGVFYMDTNSDKYNKCPPCNKTFNDILNKKTLIKMVNTKFSIQIWYEIKHWRLGYVFKTENIRKKYILPSNLIIIKTRRIKHFSNISPINIYQLDSQICDLHENCIISQKINYYKPIAN